jgi:hypothetical protein
MVNKLTIHSIKAMPRNANAKPNCGFEEAKTILPAIEYVSPIETSPHNLADRPWSEDAVDENWLRKVMAKLSISP